MTNFNFTFQFVNARETIALGSALPAVCVIIIALRFLTRKIQNAKVGADDWLALCGLFAVIGMGVCLISGARSGSMGYPTPAPPATLSADELAYYVDPTTVQNQKIEFPFQILLMLAYGFIKLSIVAFYRRIFLTHRGSITDLLTQATSVVIILWTFTFIMLIVFACGKHVWANWGSTGDQLIYCPVAFTSEYGLAISDLILDAFIFLMPLPFIWRLHLTTQRQFAVSGIFLLGASAVGASIARLILYIQVLKAITAEVDVDTNLSLTVSYYWSLLEAGLALIAACLPPMSYLLTHFNIYSILNSIRSMLSLHSLRSSQHSQVSRRYPQSWDGHDLGNLYTSPKANDSTASRATILREDSLDVELRTMQDSEEGLPTYVVESEPDVVHHTGH